METRLWMYVCSDCIGFRTCFHRWGKIFLSEFSLFKFYIQTLCQQVKVTSDESLVSNLHVDRTWDYSTIGTCVSNFSRTMMTVWTWLVPSHSPSWMSSSTNWLNADFQQNEALGMMHQTNERFCFNFNWYDNNYEIFYKEIIEHLPLIFTSSTSMPVSCAGKL